VLTIRFMLLAIYSDTNCESMKRNEVRMAEEFTNSEIHMDEMSVY